MFCRFVVLIPEESEDMWHAYNLISVGDVLKSTTIRFVAELCMMQLSLVDLLLFFSTHFYPGGFLKILYISIWKSVAYYVTSC